jgi:hypothetical protein
VLPDQYRWYRSSTCLIVLYFWYGQNTLYHTGTYILSTRPTGYVTVLELGSASPSLVLLLLGSLVQVLVPVVLVVLARTHQKRLIYIYGRCGEVDWRGDDRRCWFLQQVAHLSVELRSEGKRLNIQMT